MADWVFWVGAGLILIGSWLLLAEGDREWGPAVVGLGALVWTVGSTVSTVHGLL